MSWPGWLDLAIRSGVLLGLAEVLRRVVAKHAHAIRHRLLLWAFVLLALLPVLIIAIPELRWPLFGAREAHATVSIIEGSFRAAGEARVAGDGLFWIWICGAALALAPVVIGGIIARSWVRNAKPENCSIFEELLANSNISRRPELLVSDRLRVPVTCGVVRPRILLPSGARSWSAQRRRAVLLHELAHIERRDVVSQILVHIVAALWWFQPLVWIARSHIRLESEMACDAAAIEAGLRPSDYAVELLAIARGWRKSRLYSNLAAIGMTRSGELESRLHSILTASSSVLGHTRYRNAALLLTVAAVGISTVTAKAKQSLRESGDLIMKRSILSGLLASASLSAATVSGSLFDPNGVAVADARLSLVNPDTGQKLETMSGPDGKFSLGDAPAGEYILRVEKSGFNPLLREFHLKADSEIDRGLTLTAAPHANADSAGSASSKRIRVGGQIAESNLIRKVQPVYPPAAKQAHLQGTVELETVISKEGIPLEIRVVRSPGEELSESALEAVRQWRYRPVLLNGNPVDITTTVIVNYTLSE